MNGYSIGSCRSNDLRRHVAGLPFADAARADAGQEQHAAGVGRREMNDIQIAVAEVRQKARKAGETGDSIGPPRPGRAGAEGKGGKPAVGAPDREQRAAKRHAVVKHKVNEMHVADVGQGGAREGQEKPAVAEQGFVEAMVILYGIFGRVVVMAHGSWTNVTPALRRCGSKRRPNSAQWCDETAG